MSLPLIIYLISVSGALKGLAVLAATLSTFTTASCLMAAVIHDKYSNYSKSFALKLSKSFGIATVLFVFLALAAPSEKTAYTMLAAYGVESVLDNQDAERIMGKSIGLIESTIDKYTQESAEE